ncbi:hypothetical protein FACS1894104_4590 [Actinomycetota bacterium]|nr:hypothetical protein FACS1894104_4590 [Actinomycetota bacterium]
MNQIVNYHATSFTRKLKQAIVCALVLSLSSLLIACTGGAPSGGDTNAMGAIVNTAKAPASVEVIVDATRASVYSSGQVQRGRLIS